MTWPELYLELVIVVTLINQQTKLVVMPALLLEPLFQPRSSEKLSPTDQFPFLVSVSESRDLQAAIGVQDLIPSPACFDLVLLMTIHATHTRSKTA